MRTKRVLTTQLMKSCILVERNESIQLHRKGFQRIVNDVIWKLKKRVGMATLLLPLAASTPSSY
jgi:hypothetical protein